MTKLPEELPYIDPHALYPIGQAAKLVFVSRNTLRSDAEAKVIAYRESEKSGRKRFKGSDLIHYRDYIR